MEQPALIHRAARQRQKVETLREQQHQAALNLARTLQWIRASDEPGVTLTAAAEAMGVSKQTVNSLLNKATR